MSLFKFGDLEEEIDFTDVDFLEKLDEAKEIMREQAAQVPKVGKSADIIRAQCQCYFNFFDNVIGNGAHEAMFQGRTSLNLCLQAVDALFEFEQSESKALESRYDKYNVQQHGNRQQRRAYDKKQRSYNNKNGKNRNKHNG